MIKVMLTKTIDNKNQILVILTLHDQFEAKKCLKL